MPELLDIVGQGEAVSRLERSLGGVRRPHAYLFVGPDGVGRRTTAVAMAKAQLCERPVVTPNAGRLGGLADDFPLRQACGKCPDCRMVDAGSHADLQLVYKELARYHEDASVRARVMQDLGIDVIRSFLIAPAGRSSSRGRGKVFIVQEAELLSAAAQNALLKTLEEPPAGVTIILICERAGELLATTLSRCSLVRFGPLPKDFVTGRLTQEGVEAREAAFWAAFTAGSLGRSAELAGQGLYAIKRDLLARLAALSAAGDAELADRLAKTADKLAEATVTATRKASGADLSKNLANRQAVASILELMASAYLDAMALACDARRDLVHSDQPAAVQALAARFSPVQLAEIVEQLSEYERLLWRNVNPKIVWDNVVITCASAAPLRV